MTPIIGTGINETICLTSSQIAFISDQIYGNSFAFGEFMLIAGLLIGILWGIGIYKIFFAGK